VASDAPESVAWRPACYLAAEYSPKLAPLGAGGKYSLWKEDRRAWRLMLFAAIVEAHVPELFKWVSDAADDVEAARNGIRGTPGAFFRGCLATHLEYRGYCGEKEGMHLVGRLQHLLTRHVRWFECRQQLRQRTEAAP